MTGFVFCGLTILLANVVLVHSAPKAQSYITQFEDNESKRTDDELCKNPKIDTIFNDYRGETHIFQGERYFHFNKTYLTRGHSALISQRWPGLPGKIDAAFTHKNNKTFFFKNTTCWRYTLDTLDPGFPKNLRRLFSTKVSRFDDIVYRRNKLFIFVGPSYYVYSYHENTISKGKPISQLGLPNNIDAAFESTDGYTYFFKNDKFYLLNFKERNRNKRKFGGALTPRNSSELFCWP